RAENVHRVMSMEYLTVDPAWRKRHTGVSLASVIVSLGTRIQRRAGMGASTGVAREDVGMDGLCRDIGGVEVASGHMLYNTPVSLMCMFTDRLRELPDPEERELTETLWQTRTDLSGLTSEKPAVKRAA